MNKYCVLITASYIPSHPDTRYIKKVVESLKLGNIDINNANIILAHDGLNELQIKNKNIVRDYSKYINDLKDFYKDHQNIKIIVRNNHGHLVGNIRNALQYINSRFLLIIQHDLPFSHSFDIRKVMKDMEKTKELKHIRFNKRKNEGVKWDNNNLYGKVIKSTYYKYTTTGAWSDLNHLSSTNYYKQIIMNECKDGTSMEWNYRAGGRWGRKSKIQDEKNHRKYGTYLFGCPIMEKMLDNLDGRRNKY